MNLYDIEVMTLAGQRQRMDAYRNMTLLIVNVASQCGFTPQYLGLQVLYDQYKGQGFTVLGFPCNQFGHQEPGDAAEIERFCSTTYRVTFPLFQKINVNGDAAHPLFQNLKSEKKGMLGSQAIKWNFTKFLVGADGVVLKRYAPTDTPERIGEELPQFLK